MAVRPSLSSVTVSVAVVFFLLEVALARTPLTLHGNEVPAAAAVSDSLTVPTSEVKSSILRLPSSEVKSHWYPDPDLLARDIHDPESAEPITVRSVPLTVLRFHDLRPINRHFFPVRSRLPLRHCRHHHQHHNHDQPFFKPMEKQAAEIPYGDDHDIISSKVEEKRDLDPVSWVRLPYHHHHHHHLHHHEDDDDVDGFSKYLLKHSHRFGKDKFMKHLHHKRRDAEEDEENEEKKRENGKKEEGGFVKRIRKFLDHF